MASVPFSVDLYQGLGEAEGLLRLDADALVFEYQVRDSVLGVLKSAVRTHRVPLVLLEGLDFRRGWFGHSLRLRVGSMQVLEGMPFHSPGVLQVAIGRKDGEVAESLVDAVNAQMAGPVAVEPSPAPPREPSRGSRIMNSLRREIPMDFAFVGGLAGVAALLALLATMSH